MIPVFSQNKSPLFDFDDWDDTKWIKKIDLVPQHTDLSEPHRGA